MKKDTKLYGMISAMKIKDVSIKNSKMLIVVSSGSRIVNKVYFFILFIHLHFFLKWSCIILNIKTCLRKKNHRVWLEKEDWTEIN